MRDVLLLIFPLLSNLPTLQFKLMEMFYLLQFVVIIIKGFQYALTDSSFKGFALERLLCI